MDLKQSHIDLILKLIKSRLGECNYKALIFGSRAHNNSRVNSDVDLGIDGKSLIPFNLLMLLQNDFYESDLPFKVDLVDFRRADLSFTKNALKDGYVTIY